MARRGFLKNVKIFNAALSFLKEVRLEMKKVNWLTRREVLRHTIIVIVLSMSVAIYLGALDFLFKWVLGKI